MSDHFAAVTPSDSTTFSPVPRALYVGGTGDLTVIGAGDDTGTPVTFSTVPAGTLLPIAVSKVMATGTSASNIVAVY
ncbi:MAG TPA: hypothetical protein DEH78_08965 [Solibacterales bacterium]|nr:hypothetical protein [Bryobacterales bacterium]